MADKKTEKTLPLYELRDMRLNCEAVAQSRLLGIDATLDLQAVGRAAFKAIAEDTADKIADLTARAQSVSGSLAAELQGRGLEGDALNEAYTAAYRQNKELAQIQQRLNELWSARVAFMPGSVSVPRSALAEDAVRDLPAQLTIAYRGESVPVSPYAALLKLVDDEILILTV